MASFKRRQGLIRNIRPFLGTFFRHGGSPSSFIRGGGIPCPGMLFECRFLWLFAVFDNAARPAIKYQACSGGAIQRREGKFSSLGKSTFLYLVVSGRGGNIAFLIDCVPWQSYKGERPQT